MRRLALGQEPVGVEAERIGIQLRQVVGRPRGVVNPDLRGDRHAAERHVAGASAAGPTQAAG